MSTIRTGVIGVGHLGFHHARIYAAMDGVELAGIHDIDAVRSEKAAAEFNAPRCDSVEELLDQLSSSCPTRVIFSTNNSEHER